MSNFTLSNSTAVDPSVALRSTQILVVALTLGVALFAVVAAVMGPIGRPLPPVVLGLDAIELVAIALSIGMVATAFLLPPRLVESMRPHGQEKRVQMFRVSRVLAAAMCEGPAILWCVALLLAGKWWYLAPIALLIGILVLQIPSRDSFEAATGERVPGS